MSHVEGINPVRYCRTAWPRYRGPRGTWPVIAWSYLPFVPYRVYGAVEKAMEQQ